MYIFSMTYRSFYLHCILPFVWGHGLRGGDVNEKNVETAMLNLYKAHVVQWYDGVPFQTIEKLNEEDGVVTFSTEWPVRELSCKAEEFYERFYKY